MELEITTSHNYEILSHYFQIVSHNNDLLAGMGFHTAVCVSMPQYYVGKHILIHLMQDGAVTNCVAVSLLAPAKELLPVMEKVENTPQNPT